MDIYFFKYFFITVKQPFFVIKGRHNLHIYQLLSDYELSINNNFENRGRNILQV